MNAEISINIAPEMRGKMLGKHCLIETFIFAKKHISDVEVLTAKIKIINKASQRLFESAGFNLVSEVDNYLIYNKQFL
jgi:RimJ/RimL family protein N-acetyltransferase